MIGDDNNQTESLTALVGCSNLLVMDGALIEQYMYTTCMYVDKCETDSCFYHEGRGRECCAILSSLGKTSSFPVLEMGRRSSLALAMPLLDMKD